MPGNDDLVTAVFNFYKGQGYTDAGASYMVGALLQESGLDPDADQPDGPGKGVAQWTDDEDHTSFTALQKFAAEHGMKWDDLQTQMRFSVQQNINVTKKFKTADTPAKAKAAAGEFEHQGVDGNRWDYAEKIYGNVQAGKTAGDGMGKFVHGSAAAVADRMASLKNKFPASPVKAAAAQCKAKQAPQPDRSASVAGKVMGGAGGVSAADAAKALGGNAAPLGVPLDASGGKLPE